MTLEEILTLPARMAAMERDIIALGARPYWQPLPAPPPPVGLWTPELTEVERELLPMIAAGWSNQEIADARCREERTIRTQVSSIMGKLGLISRTQIGLWAIATGQVSMADATRLLVQVAPHLDAARDA